MTNSIDYIQMLNLALHLPFYSPTGSSTEQITILCQYISKKLTGVTRLLKAVALIIISYVLVHEPSFIVAISK